MNDHELEDALRTTFAGRAGTVTRGPGWNGADEFVAAPRRRRTRWVAPLAAAAALLAVIGVVLGLRDSSGTNGRTSPAAQRPVQAGMKAVDALGVEIFVPSKWMVDAGPCPFDGVRRPIAEPDSWRGAKCAPTIDDTSTSVTIAPGGGQLFPGLSGACTSTTVRLGGTNDVGCVYRTRQTQPGQFSYVVAWAQHHVNLSVVSTNRGLALRILQSAHAVSVDRNGCAVRQPSTDHQQGFAPLSKALSLSVCLYTPQSRLAASARLTGDAASTMRAQINTTHADVDTACDRATTAGMYALTFHAGSERRTVYVPSCGGSDFAQLTATVSRLAGIPID